MLQTPLWLLMLATFRRKGKFILLIRKICNAWKYYLWISEFAAGLIKTQHCFSYQKNVSFLMEVPPRINMFKMINTFYETNCMSLQKLIEVLYCNADLTTKCKMPKDTLLWPLCTLYSTKLYCIVLLLFPFLYMAMCGKV